MFGELLFSFDSLKLGISYKAKKCLLPQTFFIALPEEGLQKYTYPDWFLSAEDTNS